MKKYIIIIILAFISTPFFVKADVLYSQSINLSSGWNIVSTPRILESHVFSSPETSDNFDIYVLDPSKVSGWSTMADLAQTEFIPLYGYFINNKTGSNQSLTFNYDSNVTINDRLFTRSFNTPGWHSIGVANPTYAKTFFSSTTDTNNPSNVLNSLYGNYSSVLDLTDQNVFSVAIGDQWKEATFSDINTLNDLRETKGYVIYINNTEYVYTGFQNIDVPVSVNPEDIIMRISLGSNNPAESSIQVNEFTTTSDVKLLEFRLKAESLDMSVESVDVDLASTVSDLDEILADVRLMRGSTTLADYAGPFDGDGAQTITFDLYDAYMISEGDTETFTVVAKLLKKDTNFNNGATLKASLATPATGIIAEDDNGNLIANFTGSANGYAQTLFVEGATISYVSSKATTIDSDGKVKDIELVFDVTAVGDDLTVNRTSFDNTGVQYVVDGAGIAAETASLSSTASLNAGVYTVYEGQTKRFTLVVSVADVDTTGAYWVELAGVKGIAPTTTVESTPTTIIATIL